MILPKEYIDETNGVRPGPNEPSFNNIIYTTWYGLVRQRQGKYNQRDEEAIHKHIDLNNDDKGLYKPKHSHDNTTYKMIACKLFNKEEDIEKMSYLAALKGIKYVLRPWDAITYGAIIGPKLLRPLFRLFLWIPALQMIHACANQGKVRPKMLEKNPELSRWKWWFKSKKLVNTIHTENVVYKTWKLKDGTRKTSRHMQNDGKHLAIFRLYAFKDKFATFRLCAWICKKILTSKYSPDYTTNVIDKGTKDRHHPLIGMWQGYGDIL